MTPKQEIETLIIEGIHERKGRGVTVIDLSDIPTAAAIKPYNADGETAGDWVIMDYGSVWVHIFLPEVRQRYSLEELWSDAPVTTVADLD